MSVHGVYLHVPSSCKLRGYITSLHVKRFWSSRSSDLIFRVAQATGEEVRAKYNNYTSHGIYPLIVVIQVLSLYRPHTMLLLLLALVSLVVGDYPFRNISLPWEDRVNDLVGRLTLYEIQLQMARGGSGINAGPAPAIPRLGIKPYSWDTECLRGDAWAGEATSFPQALGLGASFR